MKAYSKIFVLITVMFMDILTGMEFDLFVPSFPELQNHFGLTPFWVEALLSANFIGCCLGLILAGDLSDRYGRKPIILFGLSLFVIASMLCLWPPSYGFLLAGRFFQGIGIAAPAVLSFLIIADTYPVKEQQFLLAMLNVSLNIAAGIAPVIGSYITLYFHWQGNFAALLIMGVMALLMAQFFISADQLRPPESVSMRGIKGYFAIFQSKPLLLLLTSLLFGFIPYWIFVGMSPLLYIKDLGVSLAHFGYYQGVLAVMFAIGSLAFGLLMKVTDINQKKMLQANNIILIASVIAIGFLSLHNINDPLWITLAILIFVIGQIIPSIVLYPICLNFLPQAKGRVSAMFHGARLILTAIALQIAGYFYQGTFQSIGIILVCVIIPAVMLLFFVARDKKLMLNI